MSEPVRSIETLHICGNAPALDFINTVHSRVDPEAFDYLARYENLVEWLEREDLLDTEDRASLLAQARAQPQQAARLIGDARQLRETLYRLFLVNIRGGAADAGDLKNLNRWLGKARSQQRLTATAAGFDLEWSREPITLDRALWPVLESAAELLVNGPRDRIRECEPIAGGCGWLFLDTSKNGKRRWCDMRDCGNVAKVRRYRKTQRARKN